MREIIFRGKSSNGEWAQGDLIHSVSGNIYIVQAFDADGFIDYKVIPETVGQFTGLFDKNGNKIFEGDILKAPRFNTYPYCVLYENAHFAISDKWDNQMLTEQWAISHLEAEIIGNIHDNPELLGD